MMQDFLMGVFFCCLFFSFAGMFLGLSIPACFAMLVASALGIILMGRRP